MDNSYNQMTTAHMIVRGLDLGFRIFVLLFCLTFGIILLFAGARAALAASLRPTSIITGDLLLLGDIFEGLNAEKAAMVLGPAPQPGNDMVLNTATLMRIAAATDLPWRPGTTAEQVTVRRAATVIDTQMIESVLSAGLKEKGIDGNFDIVFAAANPKMVLPQDMAASVEISELSFSAQHDTFEATLSAPSKAAPVTLATIGGTVRRLISVPVLKSTLKNGDIIGMNDIEFIEIYARDIQKDMVIDADKLSEMTPRRMIAAGKPVRDSDIENPQIVGRGDTITLVYNEGPLTLTTQGKALQPGSRGDIVRAMNISSKRAIEGIVTGEREITISY